MSDIEEEIRRQILAERRGGSRSAVEQEVRRQMLAERDGQKGAASAAAPPALPRTQQSRWERLKNQGGVVGTLIGFLLLLSKAKGLLGAFKLLSLSKFLVTGGSMLLSIVLQAFTRGWPMAIGVVLLIFVHECGHAFAAHRRGKPVGAMVFIPFMGAFVTTGKGKDIVEDAFIGIMGPVFGTLAGIACVGVYLLTRDSFWLSLASINFLLNLFNLAPVAPLDGGWIVPLFSPKLLALGAVLLLPLALLNPLIGLLGLLSIPRIIGGWKADPTANPYYQATSADRWKYGLAYLFLAAFLAGGTFLSANYLIPHRLPVA